MAVVLFNSTIIRSTNRPLSVLYSSFKAIALLMTSGFGPRRTLNKKVRVNTIVKFYKGSVQNPELLYQNEAWTNRKKMGNYNRWKCLAGYIQIILWEAKQNDTRIIINY